MPKQKPLTDACELLAGLHCCDDARVFRLALQYDAKHFLALENGGFVAFFSPYYGKLNTLGGLVYCFGQNKLFEDVTVGFGNL